MPDFHEGLFILLAQLFLTLGAALTECGNNLLRLIRQEQQERLAQATTPADLANLTQSTHTIRFSGAPTESSRANTPSSTTLSGGYVLEDSPEPPTTPARPSRRVCTSTWHSVRRDRRIREFCSLCGARRGETPSPNRR